MQGRLIHGLLEASAAAFPDKTAVVQGKERRSYAWINARANRWARWLRDSGVGPGDRVCLLSENSPDFVVCLYAILKAGGIAIPLSVDLKPDGLADLAREIEPKLMIISPRFEASYLAIEISGLPLDAILFDGRIPGAGGVIKEPFPAVDLRAAEPDLGLPIDPRSCGLIIFTSGSAGKPKGVMLSHANVIANTRSIVEYLELDENDIQMAVLPFFYAMGLSLLNTHVAVGGTVVINNRFAYSGAVLSQMAEENVTGFSGVPSTYAHLLFRSSLIQYRDRLPRLRYCSQAGGHLPRALKLKLLETLPPQARLVVMYGATEASARLSYVPPERLRAKIDSIGKPIPGVTMKVVSSSGGLLGPGEIGEIVARGDNIMLGYFRDPEATRKAIDIDGYHTGDLGYFDEDGYFYVTGRSDEQTKIGGHRVNPLEIEEIIVESGRAVECIILPIEDPLLGKKLAGLVVPIEETEGVTERILEHCRDVLPKFKVPSALFAIEAVPKNSSGKPDRPRCRELLEGLVRGGSADND